MTTSHCGVTLPRLYVYDLPETYHACIDILRLRGADGFPHVVHNATDVLPQLRQTHGYALGGVFFARALNYTCLTRNTSHADLFFVPVLSESPSCSKRCAEANCSKDAIYRRLTHLQARGGHDHVLLSPRQGWSEDLHPYYGVTFDDKRFGAASRFSAEEGVQYEWPVPATRAIFRSTPQASYIHVSAASRWDDAPWRSDHPRRVLVGWASNLHHNYGLFSAQLNVMRNALHRSCEAAKDRQVCAHLALSPTSTYRKLFDLKLVQQIGSLYWNTTFCLQPIGDACTRKAIIDGLLLGCIPVLFHPCQKLQWPWHWGGWFLQASITLDSGSRSNDSAATRSGRTDPSLGNTTFGAVEQLQHVPPWKIARMQRTIAEHAHCMHYVVPSSRDEEAFSVQSLHAAARNRTHGSHSGHAAKQLGDVPDAFEITLQGAWLLAQHGSTFVTPNGTPLRPQNSTGVSSASELANAWSTLCRRVPVGPEWKAPICHTVGDDLCTRGDRATA